MEFEAHWNSRNYVAAHMAELREHPWKTARLLAYPLLFVLVGLALVAAGKWSNGGLFIALGMFLVGLSLLWARWRWGRAARKIAAQPAVRCRADAQGLTLRTATLTETHPWADFASVTRRRGYFRLTQTARKARQIYLPTDALSEVQVDQLDSLLAASVATPLLAAGAR